MYLLDTNVISEFQRDASKRDDRFNMWSKTFDVSSAFLSVLTVYELERGVVLIERRDAIRGTKFRAWLEMYVKDLFSSRILPLDQVSVIAAASFEAKRTMPVNDAFIAATAVTHGLTLVTRNVKDFADTGVTLINPWTS